MSTVVGMVLACVAIVILLTLLLWWIDVVTQTADQRRREARYADAARARFAAAQRKAREADRWGTWREGDTE